MTRKKSECEKEEKKEPGRRQAIIDWEAVKLMLEAGCKGTEVCACLGITYKTLQDRCIAENGMEISQYSQMHRAVGDSLIRRKQFEIAMSGDKSLLIWLGKSRLCQRETKEITMTENLSTLREKTARGMIKQEDDYLDSSDNEEEEEA